MISASDRYMKIAPRQIGLLHGKFPEIIFSTVALPIVHVNSKVGGKMPRCKFMTSYGAVLALIARHGHLTVREMAHRLGLKGSFTASLRSLKRMATSPSTAWGG
jgi:hypothetical protein